MAYSGTIGNTVISVQNLIDDSARACGKLAEELTDEQVISAKRNLFYVLSSLINKGIQYWAINKTVIGLKADQYAYELPKGSVDVLNALYRTMNRPSGAYTTSAGGVVANVYDSDVNTYCQQTSTNGNIAVNYGPTDPVYAGSIGFLPYVAGGGDASWSVILEYSTDNVTWNTLDDLGIVLVTDNQWVWTDIDPGQSVPYYRIRVYNGTTLALRELFIGNNSREIQMARLNRDDYTNLPNKNFTANQPYQFYFERTIPLPKLVLWPTPNDPFIQMTVWYSRQVMDVGDLSGQIEIPDRWYLAIGNMLAHRMSLILPTITLDRVKYLEMQADKTFNEAEQEERDKSPIYWSPNIAVYTR